MARKDQEANDMPIIIGCPPKLDDKTVFLEITYNLVVEYEKIMMKLNWKLLSSWLLL